MFFIVVLISETGNHPIMEGQTMKKIMMAGATVAAVLTIGMIVFAAVPPKSAAATADSAYLLLSSEKSFPQTFGFH
jgi:Mg2+/Co2+ transporter CorB